MHIREYLNDLHIFNFFSEFIQITHLEINWLAWGLQTFIHGEDSSSVMCLCHSSVLGWSFRSASTQELIVKLQCSHLLKLEDRVSWDIYPSPASKILTSMDDPEEIIFQVSFRNNKYFLLTWWGGCYSCYRYSNAAFLHPRALLLGISVPDISAGEDKLLRLGWHT